MDADQVLRDRAAALRRASRTLGELLETDRIAPELLAAEEPLPDRSGYLALVQAACAHGGLPALRAEKRRRLLEIAARDLTRELSLEQVGEALAHLADACLEAALGLCQAPPGVAVIAMGKLGGGELNYCSDIDVIFVADVDVAAATKACEALLRDLGEFSPEGRAYEIDTNLRPEGRNGALVRSLEGYLEYYRRWAEDWEYQALIKARAAAGDTGVGASFIEETRRFVYPQEIPAERVASIRKMKERVERHVPARARRSKSTEADDVKLGPGGIRDIEFAIQLLQLVHGATDESVQDRSTLGALGALMDHGYIAEEDGAGLSVAYRWLRTVEHRLQLWQERRIRHLPRDEQSRDVLAHVMGFKDTPQASAAVRFESAHRAVLSDVRNRFEKLFYRPMIESLADGGRHGLSQEGLRERLRILGFRDADRAARTLDGLVSGTSRRAKLFRVLTPALLRFLSASPLPDEGLFGFLRLGEALGDRIDTLGALRDNPPAIELLASVLGSGRLLGEVLEQVPEELLTITDVRGPGRPKDRERLVREAHASLQWREPHQRLDGLRRFKRREMLHIALADIAGRADLGAVGEGLAHLADACLEAALRECAVPFTVIGMGKLGGTELNYASDIDVMFVHDADPATATTVAEDLLASIGAVTPEGQAFRVDAALRPEGKSGPLVRSLDSYRDYYERWAATWEFQALLKARVSAGDPVLGDKFIDLARALSYRRGLTADALSEIRHLKARMERERIPRGSDPRRHFKLGPGGTSDVEFATQVLQLEHAHQSTELEVTNTLAAVDAARRCELLTEDEASRLEDCYRFLTRLRNRLFFMTGRPVDVLPAKAEDVEALGLALGYRDQPRQELEEDYLRHTRRARKVAEKIIYG